MSYQKVTSEVFNMVKIMLKGGATIAQISEICHISSWSINFIKKAESLEDYFRISKRESRKKEDTEPVNVPAERQTIVIQASHYMLEEQKKTNELLKAISNKLAFIVTELTGAGENAESRN